MSHTTKKAFMRVRFEPTSNHGAAFTGKETILPINNPCEIYEIETHTQLLYFEFYLAARRSDINISRSDYTQYIGVFDIDFGEDEITDEDRREMVTQKKLPDKWKPLVKRLVQNNDYGVYFSGKKGLHIYVLDEHFYVKTKKTMVIKQYLREYYEKREQGMGYTDNPIDYIDIAPFHRGHGIRTYTMPHKDTNQRPILIDGDYMIADTFWEFVQSLVLKDAPFAIDRLISRERPDDEEICNSQTLRNSRSSLIGNSVYDTDWFNGDDDDLVRWIENEIQKFDLGIDISPQQRKRAGNLLCFKKQKYCFKKNDFHSKPSKVFWLLYEGCAIQRCHSQHCQNIPDFIVRLNIPPLTYVPNEFRAGLEYLKEINVEEENYVTEEMLDDALKKKDIVLLAAAMGKGKTYSLSKILQREEYKEARILAVTTRIVQSFFFAKKYNMQNYHKMDHEIITNSNRLVICLNSLPRILKYGELPQYDFLILDEFDSLVKTVTSPMVNYAKYPQRQIWDIFLMLIKKTKKVVMMDGALSDLAYYYLQQNHIYPDLAIVSHSSRPDTKMYKKIVNPFMFQNIFKRYVKNNKKCVFVSNGKEKMRSYNSIVRDELQKQSLIIDGDASFEEKMTASDPNGNWNDYDVLFYNSAVGPGPSFEEFYYDVMFVYIVMSGADPLDVYQLVNRIRVLKEGKAYIYIEGPNEEDQNAEEITFEKVKTEAIERIINYTEKASMFNLHVGFEDSENCKYVIDVEHSTPRLVKELTADRRIKFNVDHNSFLHCWTVLKMNKKLTKNHFGFYKKLKELIIRNGGVISEIEDHSENLEELKKAYRGSMCKKRKRVYQNREQMALLALPVADYDPEIMKTILECGIDLTDTRTHKIHLILRRFLSQQTPKENYVAELKEVNGLEFINNYTFFYKIAEHFISIFNILGLFFNPNTGIIQGEFSTLDLQTNSVDLFFHENNIMNELGVLFGIPNKLITQNLMENRQSNHLNLKRVVSAFGYKLASGSKKRSKVNGVRTQITYLSFDVRTPKVRDALRGRVGDERFEQKDALENLIIKNKHLLLC